MSKRDIRDQKEVERKSEASVQSYQDQSVTKEEWRRMCEHEKKWCEYQEVARNGSVTSSGVHTRDADI